MFRMCWALILEGSTLGSERACMATPLGLGTLAMLRPALIAERAPDETARPPVDKAPRTADAAPCPAARMTCIVAWAATFAAPMTGAAAT